VQNTKGAEFHPDLLESPHIRVVSKGLGDTDCYSAFDETDLALQLRRLGVEEVWVGGLATDYCVKSTVLDALKEGFRVKALTDCMRAVEVNPGDGERAIKEMRNAGGEMVEG
jgi:nicotinamidase/pyrazinamidase